MPLWVVLGLVILSLSCDSGTTSITLETTPVTSGGDFLVPNIFTKFSLVQSSDLLYLSASTMTASGFILGVNVSELCADPATTGSVALFKQTPSTTTITKIWEHLNFPWASTTSVRPHSKQVYLPFLQLSFMTFSITTPISVTSGDIVCPPSTPKF